MIWLSRIGWVLLVTGVLVLLGSFPVRAHYAGQAQLIQRVETSDADDLFGGEGTPIGTPQRMIITDPKAFLEGETPEGARRVCENYLKANEIYPLQLKTVDVGVRVARLVAGMEAVTGLILVLVARRRLKTAT